MILYCYECHENHTFTNGEVERIVYALQSDFSCAVMDNQTPHHDSLRERNDKTAKHPGYCLCDVLASSNEIEEYGEFTNGLVDLRRSCPVTTKGGRK